MTDEAPKIGGEEPEALGLGASGTNVRTAIVRVRRALLNEAAE